MGARFEIHRLGAGDLDWMRALNALFADAFEDPQSYGAAPPSDAVLAERLGRPHIVALVAVADGAVIGGLVGYVLDKLEQARSELYIYDLAVAGAHRRKGVATALIARTQAIAAAAGAWVIFVQGDYGDAPALALYDKLGVREAVLHFDLPVR